MKILHLFALAAHGLIAGTHIHECCQPGNLETHRLVLTASYVMLAILQVILFWISQRAKQAEKAVTLID